MNKYFSHKWERIWLPLNIYTEQNLNQFKPLIILPQRVKGSCSSTKGIWLWIWLQCSEATTADRISTEVFTGMIFLLTLLFWYGCQHLISPALYSPATPLLISRSWVQLHSCRGLWISTDQQTVFPGSSCKETRVILTGWKTSVSVRGCICVLLTETGENSVLLLPSHVGKSRVRKPGILQQYHRTRIPPSLCYVTFSTCFPSSRLHCSLRGLGGAPQSPFLGVEKSGRRTEGTVPFSRSSPGSLSTILNIIC